jgi:uncharacterized protein YkwD
MRMSVFVAALALASAAVAPNCLANEMPSTQAQSSTDPESMGDMAVAETASQQAQPAPLHRHPTLFGMLRRNNDIRRRVGLFPHRINPALTAAAQDHANYMARTGQFSHYTNGGPQYRAQRFGFRGGVLENIAYGTRSVDGAFNMWQGSGAHYSSIVSGTTEAGFGCAVSPTGQVYWVGVYASRASGDAVGETEEQVALALTDPEAAAAAESNETPEQPQDSNVVPASAEEPVAEAANTTGTENPAGNATVGNGQQGNYYYSNNNSNTRNRRFRRR